MKQSTFKVTDFCRYFQSTEVSSINFNMLTAFWRRCLQFGSIETFIIYVYD